MFLKLRINIEIIVNFMVSEEWKRIKSMRSMIKKRVIGIKKNIKK